VGRRSDRCRGVGGRPRGGGSHVNTWWLWHVHQLSRQDEGRTQDQLG
jgi:hypothetical protein